MMTEKTYRARKAVNKSTLWEIRRTPAHYKHLLTHPREDTAAMKMGRAVHCAILQPRQFSKEFTTMPDGIDRRTKAGRDQYDEFLKAAAGKEVLTASEMEQVQAIKKAVLKEPAARDLLKGAKKERPLFWTDDETGLSCKCRVDAMKDGIIIDLKTTTDASTNTFTRDALKRGYDVQAAHYIRGAKAVYGWDRVEWYFIVVEKDPPYAVNVLHTGDAFLDRGTWQLIDLMEKLKECTDANSWPGYGANELILPAWAEMGGDE